MDDEKKTNRIDELVMVLKDTTAYLEDAMNWADSLCGELHYPSKGDLPETSGDMHKDWRPVFAYTKELGWTVAMRFKKNKKHEWYCSNYDGNTIFFDNEIIAWIRLPEPPNDR